jgi:hypothetical protein
MKRGAEDRPCARAKAIAGVNRLERNPHAKGRREGCWRKAAVRHSRNR